MKRDKFLILNSVITHELIKAESALYKSVQGKSAESAAKSLTRNIAKAIAANDIQLIFELERQAIQCDIACYGAEEKRLSSLGSLDQAAQLVQSTSTPEGAKAYLISMNGGTLPKKIPPSDLVQNFIKNQKTQLTQMIGNTSSHALKLYRVRRKEALEHVRTEYVKNLNRGMGKEMEPVSKGLEL